MVVAVLAAAVAGCSGDEAVTVPDLVGVEVADAEEALSAAELELGDVDYELVAASSKRLDTVLSQAPSPGTEVDVGAAVALVVAKGPGGPRRAERKLRLLAGRTVGLGRVEDPDRGRTWRRNPSRS